MKNLFVLSVSILFSVHFCVNAQPKEPYVTRSFPAASIKEVIANTSGGGIILNGNAASEAVVEMFVSTNNSNNSQNSLLDRFLDFFLSRESDQKNKPDEQIKQKLEENYTIDIKLEDGNLYVVAKPKISNNNRSGLRISFKISVPKQVNSNLQTSGGSIQISNL
jgi:hypothetical protein